jgi:hypothetical protein
MAKITTANCKQAIVDYVLAHPAEWTTPNALAGFKMYGGSVAAMMQPKNWVRINKETVNSPQNWFDGKPMQMGDIVRTFNCIPSQFDESIQGEVLESNGQIVGVYVGVG